jgi:DNA polymerase III subunit epsilon
MNKIFWFDTETTGLKAGVHDAHQIAYLVDIGGEIVDEGCVWIRPTRWENVEASALEKCGVTLEELKTSKKYQPIKQAHAQLCGAMGKHVEKYDRGDKFYPGGYNCRFDYDFLQDLFVQVGDKYFGSWFNHRIIDPLSLARVLEQNGLLTTTTGAPLDNMQLGTVCAAYGINIGTAHNAIDDVKATRDLYRRMVRAHQGCLLLTPPKLAA